jgi:hypothetical protein
MSFERTPVLSPLGMDLGEAMCNLASNVVDVMVENSEVRIFARRDQDIASGVFDYQFDGIVLGGIELMVPFLLVIVQFTTSVPALNVPTHLRVSLSHSEDSATF